MDESRYSPTREPVFTETMQIGIVVRDLDATLRRYVDDYGIGPWQVHEFDPENAKDLHEYGQPVGRSWRGAVTRFATTMVGRVMWELIEPLDKESVWARFLAEKGEGVHHIAVATPNFDLRRRGGGAGQAGKRPGAQRHLQRRQARLPPHRPRPRGDHRDLRGHARRRTRARRDLGRRRCDSHV